MFVFWVLVIGMQALAQFGQRNSYAGIDARVVVGSSAEDLDPNDSFLQRITLAVYCTINDEPEETGKPLAGAEQGIGDNSLELLLDCGRIRCGGVGRCGGCDLSTIRWHVLPLCHIKPVLRPQPQLL